MNTLPGRLAIAGLLAICLGLPAAASAAVIFVNLKTDVVADDGRCSLREAVTAANTDKASGRKLGECAAGSRPPFVDVIQLRRGVHVLSRGPVGEDGNVGGDLDITGPVVIQGKGVKTFVQSGLGDPAVPGDGDRIFHVDPAGTGGFDVKLAKLTISRGDVGCSGKYCQTGASAIDVRGDGKVTIDRCRIMRNRASCSGEDCGSSVDGAAIQSVYGGSIELRASTVKKNSANCASTGCTVGAAAISISTDGGVSLAEDEPPLGDLVLDDSAIAQNESSCQASGCFASGVIAAYTRSFDVRSTTFTANTNTCSGEACGTNGVVEVYVSGGAVTVDGASVTNNETSCEGTGCGIGSVFEVGGDETVLRGATLRDNASSCQGDDCYVGMQNAVYAGSDGSIDDVAVTSAETSCAGARCILESLLRIESSGAARTNELRMSDNRILCEGRGCASAPVLSVTSTPLDVRSTEIKLNFETCVGESCQAAPLIQLYGRGDGEVEQVSVEQNLLGCTGDFCVASDALATSTDDGTLTFDRPAIRENTLACGGLSCVLGRLFLSYADEVVLATPVLDANTVRCEGRGCEAKSVVELVSGRTKISSATMTDNESSCAGVSCRAASIVLLGSEDATIESSELSDNTSQCDGDDCASGPGGMLRNSSTRLKVVDTRLTTNRTDGYGGGIFNDAGSDLTLERSFVIGNEAGLRATMEFGGFGGGIVNHASGGRRGLLTLIDSEVRGNRAFRDAGGVLNRGTIARVVGSVIAQNKIGDCVNQGGSGCP